MKKVRYAVRVAVGLAPALALAAPAAAQAAAARPELPGGTAARAGAAAKAVSWHPLQPAENYGKCTGTKEAKTSNPPGSQQEWFWYTHETADSTCIGTVDGLYLPSLLTQYPAPSYFRVRIWFYNTIVSSAYGAITPGAPGPGTYSGTTAFHQYYEEPVRVCDAWLTAHKGVIGSPACITV